MQINQQHVANQIAALLLDCGAVKINVTQPFVWASGWKSPIYTDNRLTLSYPDVRSLIKTQLVSLVTNHFSNAEGIAGVATGGIPQGALVADALNLPFVYVRSEAKGHGLRNLVEGKIIPDQRIVVVEDLISTGKSSLAAVQALRDAGAEVLGMVSAFTYGFSHADEAFAHAGVVCFPLTDYTSLINQAVEKGLVSQENIPLLESWRKSPGDWGK